MKAATLRLSYPHAPANAGAINTNEEWEAARRYRVEQVTDSVAYSPEQYLNRAEVETLCADQRWRVTIVPVKG